MNRKRIVHKLLLDTKSDIPFPSAQLTIYQPSIAEIGLLGEPQFFVAVNSLTRDYKSLKIEDNFDLDSLTNFDILMSIMREKTENSHYIFFSVVQLLELIFEPNLPTEMILTDVGTQIDIYEFIKLCINSTVAGSSS